MDCKKRGNESFEKGEYQEAIDWYSRGLSLDPTHVNLYTNRALARARLELWDESIDDCLEALNLIPSNFKAYYYLSQAQLNLKHPNESVVSALKAYEIGIQTGDASTAKAAELVLSAKKAKWEANERKRLRERNELLRETEDAIKKNAAEQDAQTEDPLEKREIADATRRKVEELYSIFALADPNMQKREVPDYMIDQLSFCFMHDPVVVPSGHSYERTNLESHLKISQTDPLTRQPLTKNDLRPNLALKEACDAFLEQNGWAVDW